MMVDFNAVFASEQDLDELKRFYELHKELAKKRGCSTCAHCRRVINLPGFVTGEECVCDAGLQCDTVLFNVKDCPKWRENDENRPDRC